MLHVPARSPVSWWMRQPGGPSSSSTFPALCKAVRMRRTRLTRSRRIPRSSSSSIKRFRLLLRVLRILMPLVYGKTVLPASFIRKTVNYRSSRNWLCRNRLAAVVAPRPPCQASFLPCLLPARQSPALCLRHPCALAAGKTGAVQGRHGLQKSAEDAFHTLVRPGLTRIKVTAWLM
jgi:hypothetical protein